MSRCVECGAEAEYHVAHTYRRMDLTFVAEGSFFLCARHAREMLSSGSDLDVEKALSGTDPGIFTIGYEEKEKPS